LADLPTELLPSLVARHAGRVRPLRNDQTDIAEAVLVEGRSGSQPRGERVRIGQLLYSLGQTPSRLASLFSCAHGDAPLCECRPLGDYRSPGGHVVSI